MKIRRRAVIVIILTNLVIMIFSVSTGIIFVRANMDLSIESDLTVMANIADHFLSVEIDHLKLKARGTAKSLETYNETRWPEILSEQNLLYPEFTGMAVINSSERLIASFGEAAAKPDVINHYGIHQAFPRVYDGAATGRPGSSSGPGRNVITSTCQTDNGVVFYMAVPLQFSHDKILVLTLPGTYFSQRLSNFIIWETGHIFMSDSEGFAIANIRDYWIQNRFNYIQAAETDNSYTKLAEAVTRMTLGETGKAYYSVGGIPRVCAFRPVSGSEEGWSIGVVAPLPESPGKNTDRGLLMVAVISIFLNIIAAIIASNFIRKPFDHIAILKEEADAANKAKSTFLSIMSHEISTPMNAILGVSEIQLQKESLDPSVKEAFEKIFTSGDLLLSIINDILDLSKIEAGKLELLTGEYEVASMINDTTQLNMMRIGSKLIKFELDIDENIPAHLLGDELRIKQIYNNLLSNAFKYTEEGTVKLSVYTEDGINKNEVILVTTVKDSGQGMTSDQVSRIFDEYSQFNQKANRLKEGTGLGMSITHNLISLMNGSIQIESEPGKGSEFIVRLPQGKLDSGILGSKVSGNLEQFNMRSRAFSDKLKMMRDPMPYGNILVVDDVEANIYVAKGLLALYDIEIDSANSGVTAINKIKSGKVYDVIFMDHMMPEMDGVEATKHIRETGYTAPIIALTANAIEGQEKEFIQKGFDDFISKPVDLRHLNLLLNKYVRDKQPHEVVEEARRQKKEKKDVRIVKTEVDTSLLESCIKDTSDALIILESVGQETGVKENLLQKYNAAIGKLHAVLEGLRTKHYEDSAMLQDTEDESSQQTDDDGDEPELLLEGVEIPGLDIARGVQRFDGNEQSYIDVLHAYVGGVSSMLEKIETVTEDSLADYIIMVHGIKGTSFDIFAEQTAKEALELEKAGKAGDLEFIKEHHISFMENTRNFIYRIEELLSSLDQKSQKPLKDKPDKKILSELMEACSDYDMGEADKAMAELEKYKYESDDDLIGWLRNCIDRMQFEEIVERLSDLLKT